MRQDRDVPPLCLQAVVGDLPVEQVQYAPSLRYLMVVLRDQGPATYKAFLSLRPNAQRMEAAHRDSMLVGVIVTLQGEGPLLTRARPLRALPCA